jgi:hypothetical protein
MAVIRAGVDHYQIVSDSDFESDASVYGTPAIMADEDTGDILFAFLDIPADDGSIRGAMGLGAVVYRLDLPDREEPTTIEDLPDGFDFEGEEGYVSPFETEDEEAERVEREEDELESLDGLEGADGSGNDDEPVPA